MIGYSLICLFGWPVFRLLYGLRVRGLANVPTSGGFVVASNHTSFFDPPVIGIAIIPRVITFMARDSLFRVPLLGWLIRYAGALPIRRGGLTRTTIEFFTSVLRDDGRGMLVFPEGTRSADGRPGEPRRGVAAMIRSAGVPVVPVWLSGTHDVWPRKRAFPKLWGRIEVTFGPPVQWSDKELDATGDPNGALAKLIMKRIIELQTQPEAPVGFWKGYRDVIRRTVSGERVRSTSPELIARVSAGR